MASYKVEIAGINTSKLKTLKHEEMVTLFNKYKQGDTFAKEELINGNLRLVLKIIKCYINKKFDMNDLFQIGCIGLIKAVDNFDLSFNVRFSTYAVPLISGEVKRYIRDNSQIRVSRSIKDLAYKIIQYKEEFMSKNGFEPSNKDIAKILEIEEYEISYALDSLRDPVSIFEPIYNDGGDTIYLMDQIADKKEFNQDKDSLIALSKALTKINARERNILYDRFIVGKTQTEIAQILNISQAQVSRIEKNGIKNLKKLIS